MISMNNIDKRILGYAFSQGNKITWQYLYNLPNIWTDKLLDGRLTSTGMTD